MGPSKKTLFLHKLSRGSFLFVSKGSVLFVFLIACFYTIHVFVDYDKDTSAISNLAFVIAAALSGLCFAFSSSLEPTDDAKDRLRYAGERFFHAALLLLTASILKYTMLTIRGHEVFMDHPVVTRIVEVPFGGFTGILFFWATMTAHTGLRIANDILWHRMARAKDWDDFV